MDNKKSRKSSGIVLAGAFVVPAIMSVAQQNTASANLGDLLKLESIRTGLSAVWANPVGKFSILFLCVLGTAALAGVVTYSDAKRDELDGYQRLPTGNPDKKK